VPSGRRAVDGLVPPAGRVIDHQGSEVAGAETSGRRDLHVPALRRGGEGPMGVARPVDRAAGPTADEQVSGRPGDRRPGRAAKRGRAHGDRRAVPEREPGKKVGHPARRGRGRGEHDREIGPPRLPPVRDGTRDPVAQVGVSRQGERNHDDLEAGARGRGHGTRRYTTSPAHAPMSSCQNDHRNRLRCSQLKGTVASSWQLPCAGEVRRDRLRRAGRCRSWPHWVQAVEREDRGAAYHDPHPPHRLLARPNGEPRRPRPQRAGHRLLAILGLSGLRPCDEAAADLATRHPTLVIPGHVPRANQMVPGLGPPPIRTVRKPQRNTQLREPPERLGMPLPAAAPRMSTRPPPLATSGCKQ